MCQLHSKLQQADIKEFQLAVEGQGMPVDVPSVHSTLKCLRIIYCLVWYAASLVAGD